MQKKFKRRYCKEAVSGRIYRFRYNEKIFSVLCRWIVLIPFLRKQKISNIVMADSVSAAVKLVQREDVFRIVVADVLERFELAVNGLLCCKEVGNLDVDS